MFEQKPVLGMLHLPSLPGSPSFSGRLDDVRRHVLADARALVAGGVQGILLENFGDAPFFPDQVPAHVVAHVTALAADVRRQVDLPLGINLLRNDALGALAIAHAVGAQFIRVNILCGTRVTDQGLINGRAHELMRLRAALGADDIRVLADVDVKHSAPLVRRPLEDEVAELVERGRADAVIVSGPGTGRALVIDELRRTAAVAGVPVIAGSGVTIDNLVEMRRYADGLIVGTALKVDGRVTNPVDPQRVRALVSRWQAIDA